MPGLEFDEVFCWKNFDIHKGRHLICWELVRELLHMVEISNKSTIM